MLNLSVLSLSMVSFTNNNILNPVKYQLYSRNFTMVWKPTFTVAAVIEQDQRFYLLRKKPPTDFNSISLQGILKKAKTWLPLSSAKYWKKPPGSLSRSTLFRFSFGEKNPAFPACQSGCFSPKLNRNMCSLKLPGGFFQYFALGQPVIRSSLSSRCPAGWLNWRSVGGFFLKIKIAGLVQ